MSCADRLSLADAEPDIDRLSGSTLLILPRASSILQK